MQAGNTIARVILVTILLMSLMFSPSLFAGGVSLSTDTIATQLQGDATQKIRDRAGDDDGAPKLVAAPSVDEFREYFYSTAISAVTHRRVSFIEVKGPRAAAAVIAIGDRLPDGFDSMPEWLQRTINHIRHTVVILSSLQPASLEVILRAIDRIAEGHQRQAFGNVPAKYDKVANIIIDTAYPVTESYATILELLQIKEDALLKLYYDRIKKGPGGRVDFFERLAVLRGDKTRNGGSLSVDPQADSSVILSAERLRIAGVCSNEGVKDLENVLEGAEYVDEIGALVKKHSLTHDAFLAMTDAEKARSVLVCTGGGDCAGLNEAIRNMIISLDAHNRLHGTNYRLVGIKNAFEGASSKQFGNYLVDLMPSEDPLIFANAIAGFPSTILGSARVKLSGEKNRPLLEQTLLNLKGFAGILPTGGNDHLEVAETLAKNGVRAVAIPKSVDNDAQTEMLGFYSAITTARHVYDTTNINKGVMVFEIMGRAAGWLSMEAASRKGIILVPEEPIAILTLVQRIKHEQSTQAVVKIMCSEGFSLSVKDPLLVDLLRKEPVLAIKYFTAINENSPDVIDRRREDPQFDALAKDYEVYLKMTPTLDPHGNPQLTGASQYVNAIVRHFIGVEPYHTDIGFALRGLSPVKHDQLMAQYYAERAVNILLDQSQTAGVAVTLPFKHRAEEPQRENIEVKQIETVTPQKTLLTEYDSMQRAEYGITIDLFFTFFDAYQNLDEKKLLAMLTRAKGSQLAVWGSLYEIALRYANNENRFDLMNDVFTVSELQQVMRDDPRKEWEQLIEEIRFMGMAFKKNYLFTRIKATKAFSQEELQTISSLLDQYLTHEISYYDIVHELRDFDNALDVQEVEKAFNAFVALQLKLFELATNDNIRDITAAAEISLEAA
jgi:6-phosphofructokinase